MGKSIGRRAKGKNGERPKGYAHGGAAGGSSGTSGGAKKPRKLDGWAAARRQAAAVPRSALQSVVTAAPRYAKFDASQRQGASDARAARMAARRGLPDDADALAEGMRTPPQQRAGASRAADVDASPELMSTHSPQLAGAVSPQPAGAASPQDAEMASSTAPSPMRAALGAAMGVLARVARSPFKGNSSSLPRGPLEPVDPTVAGDLTAADVVANAVSRAASERGSAASSPARRDERAADSSDEEGAHRPLTPKLPTPKPKAPPLEPPQPALLTQARGRAVQRCVVFKQLRSLQLFVEGHRPHKADSGA